MDVLLTYSDKHSQFATTFPIYIKERKMVKVPIESDDEDGAEDDEQEDGEEKSGKFEYVNEANWVRVNDKAPIWMRYVSPIAKFCARREIFRWEVLKRET